jgi:hypothetical protein
MRGGARALGHYCRHVRVENIEYEFEDRRMVLSHSTTDR